MRDFADLMKIADERLYETAHKLLLQHHSASLKDQRADDDSTAGVIAAYGGVDWKSSPAAPRQTPKPFAPFGH